MFQITNSKPRRIVCFYEMATIKLSTLFSTGLASFALSLVFLSVH